MEYARIAHGPQRRKGTAIPYLSHLMAVAALVMEYGGDEDQAIAALLHDVLEDCGEHHEPVIRERFGHRVADIVIACTDGTSNGACDKADWLERKTCYLYHLRTASADALLVSAADKLHNTRAILADLRAGQDVFQRFNRDKEGTLWYYDRLAHTLSARMGENHPLIIELRITADAMRAKAEHGERRPNGNGGED